MKLEEILPPIMFNRIYFEMYLPYAIKISKLGNISIIPNKYFLKEDFEK